MLGYYSHACDPACMRHRSGEMNYVYGYIDTCMLVSATVNNVVFGLVSLLLLLLFV